MSDEKTFKLITNGRVYVPEPIGSPSILLVNEKVAIIGDIDAGGLSAAGIDAEVIDASGCYVTPGFIDPHEHLLGGSGEKGFASQTPEISISEIATAGITTVVGCLGADTTTKTLPGLLAKVKALREEGMNAFMWTGGYTLPTPSITGSAGGDMMFIEEVIGAGEIAIADTRASDPTPEDLASLAHEVHVAGSLSRKAGRIHIHVGSEERRLDLLRKVIEKRNVRAEWLYVTHITRSEELMLEAIELAKNGSWVDIDTVDENLAECLEFYFGHSGWEEKLTISSDASITSPHNLFNQIRSCVVDHHMPLEKVLPLVTLNSAKALKLDIKGRLRVGAAADVLLIDSEEFLLREVISSGKRLIRDGELNVTEKFLRDSNRSVTLLGKRSTAKGVGPLSPPTARQAAEEAAGQCQGR